MKPFKSILEFQKHFATDETCRLYLEERRWGKQAACPFCASVNATRIKEGKRFQCNEKECRKQFSATVGTFMENTKVPLTKWFLAMYILSNHSKGMSSMQLAVWLDVTQKTAWFMNHRIRQSHIDKEPGLLDGIVEVDETFIGGKIKNKHAWKRKEMDTNDNKTIVFGAVSRTGKIVTMIIPDRTKETLMAAVYSKARKGAVIVSDENTGYSDLKIDYRHAKINHAEGEYSRGAAHTNTVEGFWNILKKQIVGIHHVVSPKHLQRYCDEVTFRYNNRFTEQDARFAGALSNCEGRLTYKQLIAKA